MEFTFSHNNFNVLNLEKSVHFYEQALGLKPVREKAADDGSFRIVFLESAGSPHRLELTCLRDRTEPYNLGDNEIHLAFTVDDITAARDRHAQMDCIVYENPAMGIYFIADPDGYWTEIVPAKK